MADPREVSWAEIRAAYETTDAGIQTLAERYGFSSKTSIKRRRDAEGWVKDADVVRANLATRAAQGTELGEGIVPPGVPPVPPLYPPGGYTQAQQNGGSTGRPAMGVPPGGQDSRSLTPYVPAGISRTSIPERLEMLAELRAKSEARSLRLAEKLQRVGEKLMDLCEAIADGPTLSAGESDDFNPGTSFGLAVLALRAVNADKDTLKDALKQAEAMVSSGIKLERQVLGLDQPEAGAGPSPVSNLPSSPQLSAEQLIQAVGTDIDLLRHMVDTARKVQQLRPDIEGQAERMPL